MHVLQSDLEVYQMLSFPNCVGFHSVLLEGDGGDNSSTEIIDNVYYMLQAQC